MTFKRFAKLLLASVVLAGISVLLIWAFMRGREEAALEQVGERPITAAPRLSIQEGEVVVTLDRATQERSGIVVTPLEPRSHREEVKAYGMVMDIQGLVDLRNSVITGKAQVEKARVDLAVSRQEYARLKALHADNRNISDKALQAAEGRWRADQANARAAQEALQTLQATTQQQWGGALAQWVLDASPAFNRLVQVKDILLLITIPPGESVESASQTASVQAADGTLVSAKLVSPSPRTDPRIQGMSFFYVAPAPSTGLVPGMNILAHLPVGHQVSGVVVPASAIVWWQGKAWGYVQKGPDRFIRREVPTDNPVTDGWFITSGFSVGDRLVVSGAQMLLSEEFRSQIKIAG